jgi:hypothetical protein
MFARDGVITALDTHVKGIKAPVETDQALPLQHSLDLFELMGAGDACFLVELLKLAVCFWKEFNRSLESIIS